jgi:hypothetical protein
MKLLFSFLFIASSLLAATQQQTVPILSVAGGAGIELNSQAVAASLSTGSTVALVTGSILLALILLLIAWLVRWFWLQRRPELPLDEL